MKKTNLLIATIIFGLVASPARATIQERIDNKQNKLNERIDARQMKIEERQENRQERQEERQEKRSVRFEDHAVRLEARFNAYYNRLNSIITKIQARIDAATDKNTTSASSKLSEAKTKLAEAKVAADSAVSQFKAIDPAKWEEQKTAVQTARDTANKARQGFIDTLKLINESVKLLKSVLTK